MIISLVGTGEQYRRPRKMTFVLDMSKKADEYRRPAKINLSTAVFARQTGRRRQAQNVIIWVNRGGAASATRCQPDNLASWRRLPPCE